MSERSEIEQIVISVKMKGAEKQVIYNDDDRIFELMGSGVILRDVIFDIMNSAKKDLQKFKNEK